MTRVNILYISENAVLLEWPEKICPIQHQHIMFCLQQIYSSLKGLVIDCIASYSSLVIYYKFEQIAHNSLNSLLNNIIQKPFEANTISANNNVIEIPVYYGEDSGWDLKDVAQQSKMTIDDVIKTHTQTTYRAYALGFTPGFCYLGELDSLLQLSRKSSPRLSVPKGAVAIAEQQTAIYPHTSPGGWHIIGQTPMEMYKAVDGQFTSTLAVGQSVNFVSINKTEFLALGGIINQEQDL